MRTNITVQQHRTSVQNVKNVNTLDLEEIPHQSAVNP